MNIKRGIILMNLLMLMIICFLPASALTARATEVVNYKKWNDSSKDFDVTNTGETTYTELTNEVPGGASWTAGWYVVSGDNVTIADRVTVTGIVNLILCDGAKLTASKGITTTGATLHIYAGRKASGEIEGTGELIAGGSTEAYYAGIGGNENGNNGGTLYIDGGKITATGGPGGAGIGGGYQQENGTIKITGGEVTATGGSGGVGIGFGASNNNDSGNSDIEITGGTVIACCGENALYGMGPCKSGSLSSNIKLGEDVTLYASADEAGTETALYQNKYTGTIVRNRCMKTVCPKPGVAAIVTDSQGENSSSYNDFYTAISAWRDAAAGAQLILQKDVKIVNATDKGTIVISGEKTLDLNGHGIIVERWNYIKAIEIPSDASLTLKDGSDGSIVHKYITDTSGWANVNDYYDEDSKSFSGGYITFAKNNDPNIDFNRCSGGISVSGEFVMDGGTIIGNHLANTDLKTFPSSEDTGGAICVRTGGRFTMNGGNIIGNYTRGFGGGVSICPEATFTMSGGLISENLGAEKGGGIYNNGSFEMTGGTIKDNHSSSIGGIGYGGGVYNNGTFSMSNGTIESNSCENIGGGVYNANTFSMSGGNIIKNMSGLTTAANSGSNGGGIYNIATFKLSGNPEIKDNTNAGSVNNVYLIRDTNDRTIVKKITIIGTLTNTTPIGISIEKHTQGDDFNTFTGSTDTSNFTSSKFKSEISGYGVYYDAQNQLKLAPADASITKDGNTNCYATFVDAYANWVDESALTILKDIEVTSTIDVSGKTNGVSLDLNGYGIKKTGTSTGSVINVKDNSKFTLLDSQSSATEHKYTLSSGLATVNDKATGNDVQTFKGGYITGGYAENGGGINVSSGCELIMNGGTVIGNIASQNGGGVCNDGIFVMTGGKIIENRASRNGCGVYDGGTFKLSNTPTITSNTFNGITANNVYLESGKLITIDGALSNTDKIGITMAVPGIFTDGWEEKMPDANATDNFVSDSSDKIVIAKEVNDKTELALVDKWGYSLSENIVTATCNDSSITDKPTFSISISSKQYDGSVLSPTITQSDDWTTNGLPTPSTMITYTYEKKTGDASYEVISQAPKDAGDYKITATVKRGDSEIGSVAMTAVISKAAAPALESLSSTQKPTALTPAYTGSAQDLVSAPTSAMSGYTVEYSLDGTNWGESIPQGTDVNEYVVHVRYVGDSNHESFVGDNITVNIVKATGSVTSENQKPSAITDIIYDSEQHNLVTAPSSKPEGYTKVQYRLSDDVAWEDTIPIGINAGEYSVQVKYIGDANHNDFVGTPVAATIALKAVTVKADDASKKYSEADPSFTATVTGTIGTDNVTYTVGRSEGENVGTYDITPVGETNQGNYAVTFQKGTFTISAKSSDSEGITAQKEGGDLIYSGAANTPEIVVKDGDDRTLVNDTDYTVTYAGVEPTIYPGTDGNENIAPTGAGAYKAIINFKGNYSGSKEVSFTIEQKEIGITWSNVEFGYDGNEKLPTATATGLVTGDSCEVTVTGGQSDAGTYVATASALSNGNYKLPNDNTVSYTIAPKSSGSEDIKVTRQTDEVITYNGSSNKPIIEVKDGDDKTLVEDTDYTLTYVGIEPTVYPGENGDGSNAPVNAGSYKAVVTFKGNYSGNKEITFNISKATPTVATVPTATPITYGQMLSDSTLMEGTVSGADNKVIDGTFNWVDGTIKPAFADNNKTEYNVLFTPEDDLNYNTVNTKVKLTVNKAVTEKNTLTDSQKAAAVDELKYDNTSHELVTAPENENLPVGYTKVQYRLSDTEEWSDDIPTGKDAGNYNVQVRYVGDENHEDLIGDAIEVTIGRKSVTVKAVDASKTYGEADPVFTADVTGTIGSDTVNYTFTRAAGEDVNTYVITPSGTIEQGNYEVTYQTGTFTISAKTSSSQDIKAEQKTDEQLIYTGTSNKPTIIVKDGDDKTLVEGKDYTITYEGVEPTVYPGENGDGSVPPTNAGNYKAEIAFTGNYTGKTEVEFGIAKGKHEAPAADAITTENAEDEEGASGKIAGFDETKSYQYSSDDGETWNDVTSGATSIDVKAGTYDIRIAGDDNHNPSTSITVVVGVTSRTQGIVNFNNTDVSEGGAAVETVVESAKSSNIEEYAQTQVEEGKDVKVELEIIPKNEDEVATDSVTKTEDVVKDVFAGIDTDKVVTEYFEIDLAKYVDNKEEGKIDDTGKPLEIELAYDASKAGNPVVIRTHKGKARAFEKLKSRPDKDFKDATYYITNGIMYIYSQFFSDFAIVYATEKTYSVSIDTGVGEPIIQVVGEDSTLDLPTDLTKDGYAFGGWFKDVEYVSPWDVDNDKVNADTKIYGKWDKTVSGVSVESSEVKLTKAGDTSQIKVTVTPSDAANKKVTYASSNPKVVTVDENGKITAVANGNATITVTTEDGAKTATVKVMVAIPDVDKKGATENQETADKSKNTDQQKAADQQKTTDQQTVEPTKEEKAAISMNAGLKISQTGSKINIKWGKVKEADGYDLYVTYCGESFAHKKPAKTFDKNTTVKATITKINGKKINPKKNFKLYVAAYKMVEGKKEILAKTITGHVVGRKNTKYSNAKNIKITSKTKVSIKQGKTSKIKAKTVLVSKGKKQLSDAHAKEFRYASSNKSIATVNKNGKIKGIAKGTCIIYVYSRNGYAKKVSVTVK